jgi:hypothetical protein
MTMKLGSWQLVLRMQRAIIATPLEDPLVQQVRRGRLDTQVERERAETRDRWLLMGGGRMH